MRISYFTSTLAIGTVAAIALAGLPTVARAATTASTVTIDFEALPATGLYTGPGKNSTASASVSADAAHSGARGGKVKYAFDRPGYIEFQLAEPVIVSDTVDPLSIVLWVKGDEGANFASVALRLQDDNGNIYQYAAPGLSDKLNSSGWARYQVTLEPAKALGSWGPAPGQPLKAPLRFFGFGADRSLAAAASGTIDVDDITVTAQAGAPAASIPAITISADRDILIERTGEPVTFKAAIGGANPGATKLRYRWRVRDFNGVIVSDTAPAPLTDAPDPLVLKCEQPGYYAVAFEALDSTGGIVADAHASAAFFQRIGASKAARGVPMIGVCSHLQMWPPEKALKQVEIMRRIGFEIDRDGDSWEAIEPTEGVWRWDRADAMVDALRRANIELLYLIGFSAKWASTGNVNSRDWRDWWNAPPVTEKYAAFAQALVRRYKQSVHYWEIWNEPDLTSWRGAADQYAALLNASVKAIHQADPSSAVMNGGISEVNFRPGFVDQFLKGASPRPDVFAYHSHGDVENMVIARTKVNGYLATNGMSDTPVWLNEAGISAVGGVSLRQQAIVLARKIATSESLGDRAYILYDLTDDGTNPADPEHHMGVVLNDMNPKPATVAVHTVIDRIGGKKYDAKLAQQAGQVVYSFRSANETTAIFWSDRTGASGSLLVRSDAPSASFTDLMGVSRPLRQVRGYYIVPIDDTPAFLTLAGGHASLALVKPVIWAPSASIVSDSTTSYRVTVNNPLSTRLTGALSLASDTLSATPSEVHVDIAPGGSATYSVRLGVLRNKPAHVVRLHLAPASGLPAIDDGAVLRTAMNVPVLAPGAQEEAAPPTAVLSSERNEVSLFEATPISALKFHGPSDLSARLWLYQTAQGIRVHVAVTDDVQCQTEQPGLYWKGDSLQIAMVGPSEKFMEWTAALTSSGPRLERSSWPAEFANAPALEKVDVTRAGDVTTYDVTLPWSIPEIGAVRQYGCRMSLLVNDNDGAGRKGWVEWTPGIGMGKDAGEYVPLAFAAN